MDAETLIAAADELDLNARFFEAFAKRHQKDARLAKGSYGEKHAELAGDLMTMARNATTLAAKLREGTPPAH